MSRLYKKHIDKLNKEHRDMEEDYIIGKKSYGFYGENGDIYLVRCPECKRENYAMAVSSGTCAWCGWDVKDDK